MEDPTQATPYTRRLGGQEATYWTMGVYLLTWLAEGKDTDGTTRWPKWSYPKAQASRLPTRHDRYRGGSLAMSR